MNLLPLALILLPLQCAAALYHYTEYNTVMLLRAFPSAASADVGPCNLP